VLLGLPHSRRGCRFLVGINLSLPDYVRSTLAYLATTDLAALAEEADIIFVAERPRDPAPSIHAVDEVNRRSRAHGPRTQPEALIAQRPVLLPRTLRRRRTPMPRTLLVAVGKRVARSISIFRWTPHAATSSDGHSKRKHLSHRHRGASIAAPSQPQPRLQTVRSRTPVATSRQWIRD